MNFLEKKEKFSDIFITSIGVFIAGLIGSLVIFIIAFLIGNQTEFFSGIEGNKFGTKIEGLYTILMALITLIGTVISSMISYKILGSMNPEKYKKNNVIFIQIALFQILVYIFITPIYLFFGGNSFENIIYSYIFHILIIVFGTNIILDILNNYRYILIGIYGSFIGLFISILISIFFFNLFSSGIANLISLVFLLPIINFSINFFKKIFELIYFYFYKLTGNDPIGDIFYKIKKEDEEAEKEEAQKNMI